MINYKGSIGGLILGVTVGATPVYSEGTNYVIDDTLGKLDKCLDIVIEHTDHQGDTYVYNPQAGYFGSNQENKDNEGCPEIKVPYVVMTKQPT